MFKNKKFVYSILVIIVLVLGIAFYFANTYGFFEYFKRGTKHNTVKVENVVLELEDTTSLGIDRDNSYPLSDEVGRSLNPYKFKINNLGGTTPIKIKLINDTVEIERDNCSNNLLSESSIRYQLIKDDNIVIENILNSNRIIYQEDLSHGEHEYELRVWIDKDAGSEIVNKHFHGKIEIEV